MVERPERVCGGSSPSCASMKRDYILANIQEKNVGELYLPQERNDGRFKKGHKTWNKGKTWDDMGISKETQRIMRENLAKYIGKGNPNIAGSNSRPVIVYDDYGNKCHWFKSSSHAARKLGLQARNIIRSCRVGYRCGGFNWRYDERFNKEK